MPPWTVSSETGRLTEVLVCAPDHYRWIPANAIARRTLAAGGQPDLQGLRAQHRELVAALEQGGARIHHLPPQPHMPYMAYTRDSVVVTHRGPVLCQLERPQPQLRMAPAEGLRLGRAPPGHGHREARFGEQPRHPAAEAAIAAEDEHPLHPALVPSPRRPCKGRALAFAAAPAHIARR